MEQRGNLGAGLVEEGEEDRHLCQEGQTGDEADAEGVDEPLGDHRAQRLGK